MKNPNITGFGLVELVIVIAICAALSGISISTFVDTNNRQSLQKDVESTLSLIEKGRNQTLNAKDNSVYSVRFASSSVTLFPGTIYNSNNASNTILTLSSKVEISSISLTGSASQSTFEMITGKSSATGTVKFRLKQDTNASSTIILYKTGLAETQ